jgi:hypothetical protein
MENCRISIRKVTEDVGIWVSSCHVIFSDVLVIKHVVVKFDPKLLNFDHKNSRVSIAQELLNDISDHPDLLKRA